MAMLDMYGTVVTVTEHRCETCNEIREYRWSDGSVSGSSCKCAKELHSKLISKTIKVYTLECGDYNEGGHLIIASTDKEQVTATLNVKMKDEYQPDYYTLTTWENGEKVHEEDIETCD